MVSFSQVLNHLYTLLDTGKYDQPLSEVNIAKEEGLTTFEACFNLAEEPSPSIYGKPEIDYGE